MERYSTRGIDDLGKMVLPTELRKKLELEQGVKLLLYPIGTIAVLEKTDREPGEDSFLCEVDELGRIDITGAIRAIFGWEAKSRIAIYNLDNVIFLKSDEQTEESLTS